jgi:hypothetical protein
MIKFFRRVRQRLLSENKFSKYLLYAIGEIALVMIGILLALQVNNWNQSVNNAKKELYYLEKLQSNIAIDTMQIGAILTVIESYLQDLDIIQAEMKESNLERFSLNPSEAFLGVVGMKLETSTWENLKSTGKIDLIQNFNIVDSLHFYYKTFENVNENWNEGFSTYSRNILAPKFFSFDDFIMFGPDSSKLNRDVQRVAPFEYGKEPFFRNAVRFRNGALSSIRSAYEADLERAENLLALLDEELGNRK